MAALAAHRRLEEAQILQIMVGRADSAGGFEKWLSISPRWQKP
jgi:hypothetical protein